MSEPILLIVPRGSQSMKVELPRDVANWLFNQLAEALGLADPVRSGLRPQPRRRRPVKLHRGRWRP